MSVITLPRAMRMMYRTSCHPRISSARWTGQFYRTFILDVGANASAARLRTAASNLRHRKEDVLMAMSHSNRISSESRKVSAPMENLE